MNASFKKGFKFDANKISDAVDGMNRGGWETDNEDDSEDRRKFRADFLYRGVYLHPVDEITENNSS